MEPYDIALLGGDARTGHMHSYLSEKGYKVICYGTEKFSGEDENQIQYAENWREAIEKSRCLVGGIPLFKEGKLFSSQEVPVMTAEDLCKCMKKQQFLFGGVLPENFREECRKAEIQCYDFMEDEPLAVFNAIATAEGAILEALRNQDTNIHGSESLVLGYGRCGRVLAEKLKGLGAKVTVCSRCATELACADTFGMEILPLQQLKSTIARYEYVYNTVPALLLSGEILKQMKKEVLIIDIASGAGGVDFAAAKETGLHALHCTGLPGKYAPKISAKGLAGFVMRTMSA